MKYPGKKFRKLCGATDGCYGKCNLPAGHHGKWHQEKRGRTLLAEWRGPHPGEACTVCGKDGRHH